MPSKDPSRNILHVRDVFEELYVSLSRDEVATPEQWERWLVDCRKAILLGGITGPVRLLGQLVIEKADRALHIGATDAAAWALQLLIAEHARTVCDLANQQLRLLKLDEWLAHRP